MHFFFLYTAVSIFPGFLLNKRFRKEMILFFSNLIVKFIFLWKQLSANNTLPMYFHLVRQYIWSVNLFYNFTLYFKFRITDASVSTMNMIARTRPNGTPIEAT